MWLYLALFSAIIYSLRSIVEKLSLAKINKYILAFGLRLFALPFFVLPFVFNHSLFISIYDVPFTSWIAILFVSVISSPIEILFFYKALQISEVTTLVPLLSLAPIFTTLFNIFIFKSFPSLFGIIGIVLIIISVYILNMSKAKKGLFEPFLHLSREKSTQYLIVMMLFYSLGVVVDKLAISGTNPYYYALVNYIFVSITLGIIAKTKATHDFGQIKDNFITFVVLGAIVFLYTLPRNLALQGGNAGYVSAILSSSVIISTVLGFVFLKENNALIKIFASLIAFLGVIVLKLCA